MIVDLHCDTVLMAYRENCTLATMPSASHFDLDKAQRAGVKIQFYALFPGISEFLSPLKQSLILSDYFWKIYLENRDMMQLITSSESLLDVIKSEKSGALLTVEGGEVLEGNLWMLRVLYRLGVRSLCLTWNNRNEIADGVAEALTGGGLTTFGKEVVRQMNSMGMLIDVSHISENGFWDVLDVSDFPVIASHSNASAIYDHPRNLTDSQIKGIAQKGGVIGLNFVADFYGSSGKGLECLFSHIDHICGLVGEDYLAFGSDFDGTDNLLSGVKDVTIYPEIISYLRKKNYKETAIRKICSENILRVLNEIL